jgi:hypothetical protein
MKELLKRWWEGTYVPPKYDPSIMRMGNYERDWSSKAAHAAMDFWLKYWQWCMGFGLAVIGLIWKH